MITESRCSFATLTLLGCGLLLAAGCGDDDGGTNDVNNNNGMTVDAGVDGGTGESLDFIILDSTYGANVGDDGTPLPLQGARVAVDLPGGERVELVSGADGKVTVDGIDWSLGNLSITAHIADYVMVSYTNLDASLLADTTMYINNAIGMYLERLIPDVPELQVTGTAIGLVDPAHRYQVNVLFTEHVGTEHDNVGGISSYTVEAPGGLPFTIQGIERDYVESASEKGYDTTVYRVMQQEVAATSSASLVLDLDFEAYEVPTYTADASMFLPADPNSTLRDGRGSAFVCSANSLYCFGWASHIDVSADGSYYDVDLVYTQPALADTVYTVFRIINFDTWEFSMATVLGFPDANLPDVTLLEPPQWITPADPLVAHPVHETMELDSTDGLDGEWFYIQRNGRTIWRVGAGTDRTAITVPAAPSSVNENQFLGTSFTGYVVGLVFHEEESIASHYLRSQFIRLTH
ncbi:MAG: hypothetical protein ABI333_29730 [bacterium]